MSTVPPSERPARAYPGAPTDGGWTGHSSPQPPPPVGSPQPGAWTQSPPGYAQPPYSEPTYAQPPYAEPAYEPQPGPSGAPGSTYRPPRARRAGPSWVRVAPALFASLVISAGILVLFLGNLFVALGAPRGTPGRERLLQFLSPADLAAAAAVALAVALVVLQRRVVGDAAPIVGPPVGRARSIALLAGAVAAVLAIAALVRGIVYLTVPHVSGAVKVGYFIVHLAIAAIGGAAAAWGLRNR